MRVKCGAEDIHMKTGEVNAILYFGAYVKLCLLSTFYFRFG
jgi:hypothetical protein